MKVQGINVVDLSAGEPDFCTPYNIKNAAIKAINENFTKYTETDGTRELKSAIISRLKEDQNLDYTFDEVIVATGAKSALFNLIFTLLNEGDEVIIPSPYWVSYPEIVNLAGGKSVFIEAKEENNFKLDMNELRSVITPRTKAIILNNPQNPTGTLYSEKDLRALAEIVLQKDMYVIADEIYEKLVYDGLKFTSFASLSKEAKNKTIIIDGVSKSYAMTGWRIGYAVGPKDIINGMKKIQSHSTSNPCSISQKAAGEALTGSQGEVNRMVSEFENRRNYLLSRLLSIKEIFCCKPNGSFYLFPNVSAYYNREYNGKIIRNSNELAHYLLQEGRVALVPGEFFGSANHIRITYAQSMENLEKAMNNITNALALLESTK